MSSKSRQIGNLFCPPPPPPPPPVFLWPPVTNYRLLYSTLLCKEIARAPGGHKKFMLTILGAQNRIDPKLVRVDFKKIKEN